MFSSLTSLFRPKPKSQPEHDWQVSISGGSLHCAYGGKEESIRWDTITEISLITNDEGPFLPDVFWQFRGSDGMVVFPQMAVGEKEIIDRAMELPGFDFAAASQAMSSTANAEFIVWKKRAELVASENGDKSPPLS